MQSSQPNETDILIKMNEQINNSTVSFAHINIPLTVTHFQFINNN